MPVIPQQLQDLFAEPEPLDDMFGRLMEVYGRAVSADRCLLFLYEPRRGLAHCSHEWVRRPDWSSGHVGEGWPPLSPTLADEDPMFALALRDPEPLYIDDVLAADAALVNGPYEIEHFGHRGLIHAPLMADGLLWGILEPCVIAAPRHWTAGDRAVTDWVQQRLTPLAIRYVEQSAP